MKSHVESKSINNKEKRNFHGWFMIKMEKEYTFTQRCAIFKTSLLINQLRIHSSFVLFNLHQFLPKYDHFYH